MKKSTLCLALLLLARLASAAVIDAPHNATNHMTCSTCHSYSLWWQYSPSTRSLSPSQATVVNTVCMECHDSGSLLGVRTHSAAVTSSTNNYHQGTGGWGVGCTECHNPHYQEQLGWGAEAFLVEGKIDRTADNNGISNGTVTIAGQEYDQTTIAIASGLTEKDPVNWPMASWAQKTGTEGRGLILSQDTTINANTFTVLSATATEIVVKGKLDPEAVIPDSDPDGPGPKSPNTHYADTFGLAYGQLIKKAVVVPYSDPDGAGPLPGESRTVKFVNPIGGFVDTVNSPATGICQVCHTLTADHGDPANPTPRFRNYGPLIGDSDGHADYATGNTVGGTSTCTICHSHQAGFKGAGHGKEDFGWAPISYSKADGSMATVNCAACHDGSQSVIEIHGYRCVLCHVKKSGGKELRVAGSSGNDAVNTSNGVDGDPSGATLSSTCATCHDKAAKPNIANSLPQIHHAASSHNYAVNNDCSQCHKSATMADAPLTKAADHSFAIGLATTTGVAGSVVNGCDACHQRDDTTGTDYSTHGTGIGAIIDSDPTVFDNPRVHDRCVSCHTTDGGLKDFTQITPASIEIVVAGYAPGHGSGSLPDLDQPTNCFSCHGIDPGLTHLKHSHALTVGNTPQCNWCHVDQIGLNDGAKTDPNNDMVHDACTTCHTISKGVVGDYTVGMVDPLDLTRYPPLVDQIETPLHKGSAVVCTDCHGIHLFADHQHADHTPVVMTSSEGCTGSCHMDTDGNGPPNFSMNLNPLDNRIHDECTSCHDTADGQLRTVAEVNKPYVVAMPDGGSLPNKPNDGGGECSACHGGAYFARHRAIDHTTRVVASALCSTCHPAASIAGTSTGIPVDPGDNKVHDACSTCHEDNGELKGAYGRASAMPVGGGSCVDCHGDSNHDHSTLVRVNTVTAPVVANCVGCHGATTAPFVGPGEVHSRLGCQFCHRTADFTLIGSAAGKTGGGECTTCHNTHFTGHSHTHLVAQQTSDLAQGAPGTVCSACHNDAGEALATWSAVLTEHRSSCATCHNATRLTGNPSAPTETVQQVIAANADPTACLACHWSKKSPAGHGHVATDFTWAGSCSSCHAGADIIVDVHGRQCALCHADPAAGEYSRRAGTDGDATLAGTSNTASCTVCHDPAPFPTAGIHHDTTGAVNNGCTTTCHTATAQVHTFTAVTLCTTCHTATAAPFATSGQVHAQQGCQTCHSMPTGNLTGSATGKAAAVNCESCHAVSHETTTDHNHRQTVDLCAECHAVSTPAAVDALHRDDCLTCHDYNGGKLEPATVAEAIISGQAGVSVTCQTCHTVALGSIHHSSAKAANNECVSCHALVDHTPMVHDSALAVCVGCHTGTAGTTFGMPVNPADPKLHFACRTCHTFDANKRGILVNFTNKRGVNGNSDLQLPDGGTIGGSDGGGACTDCHTGVSQTFHHVNPHAAVGECEQCHIDPRPGKGQYRPGDNGGTSQYPTQLACRACHVRFVDGALTVVKYTRTNYDDLSTPWATATQHAIPGVTQGQINNYGICFSCHGEGTATKVRVFHARPDQHDTNNSWALGSKNWRRHDAPGPQMAFYAAGRSSSGIGWFNSYSVSYEAATGDGLADFPSVAEGRGEFRREYFENATVIRENNTHWYPYKAYWYPSNYISIPAATLNASTSGSVFVLAAVTRQTIADAVADPVKVEHAVYDGADLTVIATNTGGCGALTASYGGTNLAMSGSDNCTAVFTDVNYPADGTTVNVTTANVEGLNVIGYPIANQPGGVAVNDFYPAFSGNAKPLPVLANDLGTGLHLQAVGGAGHGEVVISGDMVNYTATAGYSGKDSFSYTVTDSNGKNTQATVTLTVVINQEPIAKADAYAVASGGDQVVFNVLDNDTDGEGELLTISAVTQPAVGTAVNNGTTILYTPPPAGFDGETAFSYQISDGMGNTVTAAVQVRIAIPHDWVTVLDPWPATPQLSQKFQIFPLYPQPDAEGYWPSAAVPTFTVSPGLNRLLLMSVTLYRGNNPGNQYNEELVKATYGGRPLTKASIHTAISYYTATAYHTYTTYLGYLTEADLAAANGNAVTLATRTGYASMTASIASYSNVNQTAPIAFSGGNTYQTFAPYPVIAPATAPVPVHAGQYAMYNRCAAAGVSLGFSNSDSEGYIENINLYNVTSSYVDMGLASKLITVDGTTNPFMPKGKKAASGTSSFIILNNVSGVSVPVDVGQDVDTDQDGIVEPLDQCPNTATGQSINSSGCALAQVDTDNDRVSDAVDQCPSTPSGQVVVADGCPAAPVAVNDSYPVYSGIAKPLAVMTNDKGTGLLSLQSVGAAGHGEAVISGNNVLYTATAGYSGTDSFSYTITDINGKTSQATVSLTIAINQTPVAGADVYTVAAGNGQIVFNVLDNDTDGEGEPLTITSIAPPSVGTAVIDNGTSIIYTPPAAGIDGDIAFTYQISDGMGHDVSGEVTVTIATPRDWVTVLDPWTAIPQLSQKWQPSSPDAEWYYLVPNSPNFTVSRGLNRLLVMSITYVNFQRIYSPHDFVKVTYGGIPLTKASIVQTETYGALGDYNYITYLGYLKEEDLAAATGSAVTVSVQGGYYAITAFMASYGNVNQSTPITVSGGNRYNTANNYPVIDPVTAPFPVHAGQYAMYNRSTDSCAAGGGDTEQYNHHIDYIDYNHMKTWGYNAGLASKLITYDGTTNPIRNESDCSTPGASSFMVVNNVSDASVVVDTDRDGVAEPLDQCPDTIRGESVNSDGCALNQTAVPSAIAFRASSYSLDEDNGEAYISVSRTGSNLGTVSVHYATTTDGTATAGTHYTPTSGTLDWGVGDMTDKVFTVSLVANEEYDVNKTVTLELSSPIGSSATLGVPSTAVLTIVNDEPEPPATIAFPTSAYSVQENGGTATITVSRSAWSLTGAVDVSYETNGGDAVDGMHYTATSGTLHWDAGDMIDKTFTVSITDNGDYSSINRRVGLLLKNATGGAVLGPQLWAQLTIVEDEVPAQIAFAAPTFSVNENGGTATITVKRSGNSVGAVQVYYQADDGVGTAVQDVDYPLTWGYLTWADGDTTDKTFTVGIVNNSAYAVDKTVVVSLYPVNMGNATLGAPSSATLTIVNDEPLPSSAITFRDSAYSVNENAGTATITLSRTGVPSGAACVSYAAAAGATATADVDYTAPLGTLCWDDGDLEDKTFAVNIIDNLYHGANKTVDLALSAPTGDVQVGSPNAAVLTIVDDEVPVPATIALTSATYSVNEDAGTATITMSRFGSGTGPLSVGYATTGGGTATAGVDYTATSGTLEWADGDLADKTFTISIIDNAGYAGDKTVNLATTALGDPNLAVLTIVDNESLVAFSAPTYSVDENGGTVVITARRTGSSRGAAFIHYRATWEGSAYAGSEYTYQDTLQNLYWADGDLSDKTFTLSIIDNALVNDDKTLYLTFENPKGNATFGAQKTTVLTIKNDEDAAIAFTASAFSVKETGGMATITVTRSRYSTGAVGVSYATTTGGTALPGVDYTATSGTLNWSNNDMADKSFTIPITYQAGYAGNKTVNLTLSSPTGHATIQDVTNTAELTITEDETAFVFSASNYSVNEEGGSGKATITVSRLGSPTADMVYVYYEVANCFDVVGPGMATPWGDFQGCPAGALVWNGADMGDKTFTVTITPDAVHEGDETANLRLFFEGSPPQGLSLGTPNTAVLTIIDND